jgi:RNA polymerase sigma factor (sigma-70 family)
MEATISKLQTRLTKYARYLCRGFAGNFYSPQDLLQDTNFKMIKNYERYKDLHEQQIVAYAVLVMKRTFIDYCRVKKQFSEVADSVDNSTRDVELQLDIKKLYELIDNEDLAIRAVKLYSEGFSYNEIAQILSVCKNSVSPLIYRARGHIRSAWSKQSSYLHIPPKEKIKIAKVSPVKVAAPIETYKAVELVAPIEGVKTKTMQELAKIIDSMVEFIDPNQTYPIIYL